MKTDQGEPWKRFLFPSVFQDFPNMGIAWVLKLAFHQTILNLEVHNGPDNLFQNTPQVALMRQISENPGPAAIASLGTH